MNEHWRAATASHRRLGQNDQGTEVPLWRRLWEFFADNRLIGLLTLTGVIVGFLALIVAILTLRNDLSSASESTVVASQPEPAGIPPTAVTPVSGPPSNGEATAEPTTEPTPNPTAPSPSRATETRTLFQDSFRLKTGEGINLDAGETKIQQGVSETDGDSMDLYVDGWASGNLKAAHEPDGQTPFFTTRSGTLNDCVARIQRGEDAQYSAVPETTSNLHYCFLTSERRVAAMRISGRKDGAVPVTVTVWDRVLNP